MSLELAAKHLAAKGRGPDTQLVHMAPQEVAGLQALAKAAGGTLTTNPDTGLPEAGFLNRLLPTLIGAGLSVASGGTLTPLMAAMITGGGTAAMTGSLRKGLMAGLGAYGGAGIGSAISQAGTGAISAAATPTAAAPVAPTAAAPIGGADLYANLADAAQAAPAAQTAATDVLNNLASGNFSPADIDAARQAMAGVANPTPANLQQAASEAIANRNVGAPIAPRTNLSLQTLPPVGTPAPAPAGAFTVDPNAGFPAAPSGSYTSAMYGGDPNVPTAVSVTPPPAAPAATPDYARTVSADDPHFIEQAQQRAVEQKLAATSPTDTFKEGLKAIYDKPDLLFNKQNAKYGLAAIAPMMAREQKAVPADTEQYRYTYDPGRLETPSGSGELRYFNPRFTRLASGGVTPSSATGPLARALGLGGGGGDGGDPYGYQYDSGSQQYTPQTEAAASGGLMAKGGISHLGDYSDGGRLLRGPGDGVSDSIPATIGRKRPARLADGEFVVPARIVSELGNGSTEAGARKLYAMMDRVQKNRRKSIGKGKVAVNSRSDKLLPA